MHQNAGFCIKNIHKNSGSRDPRTPAAEGETFVRTHPRAHLPDSGAPPNLLGWLRPYPSPIHESNGNHFSDRSILVGSNSLE